MAVCVERLIKPETLQSKQGAVVSEPSGVCHHSHAAESSSAVVEEEAYEETGVPDEEQPLIEAMECRICQEEDSIKNLEAPCACSGSLKVSISSTCISFGSIMLKIIFMLPWLWL